MPGKGFKEFYHASNDNITPVQPDNRLHAVGGDHHVSRGRNGGQEMTRYRTRCSSRLRQACDSEERRGDHLDQRGAHHERRGA